MKKIILLFVLTALCACEELERLTVFSIDYDSEFEIAATTIIDVPISLETPPIPSNTESEFANNNTRSDLIESIRLERLVLTITSPEDGNFNFIKELSIFIKAEGLEEVQIAFAENIENTDSDTLELETTSAELKEYLKRDSYSLRVLTETDETINEDHTITIDGRFRVDANVLGL